MLHGLGMLSVGASEPSCYVFPLVPHAAASDLPGGRPTAKKKLFCTEILEEKTDSSVEPPTKPVWQRPNLSKYINNIIMAIAELLTAASAHLRLCERGLVVECWLGRKSESELD
ncbi:unnamed protein product [Phytophthora fragariaefolia]|uniref:Unnamed protein product n=1 Tax=Phytophthora fragariaefolia TaxID=1490495 RepID=A0A9W7D886_9STRA|nr:unnamed protein product [Phytophthora fragariaefolia]